MKSPEKRATINVNEKIRELEEKGYDEYARVDDPYGDGRAEMNNLKQWMYEDNENRTFVSSQELAVFLEKEDSSN
jgi:hypothetical protein